MSCNGFMDVNGSGLFHTGDTGISEPVCYHPDVYATILITNEPQTSALAHSHQGQGSALPEGDRSTSFKTK